MTALSVILDWDPGMRPARVVLHWGDKVAYCWWVSDRQAAWFNEDQDNLDQFLAAEFQRVFEHVLGESLPPPPRPDPPDPWGVGGGE